MDFRQARIKDNLNLRARILQAVRDFFIADDYLEVETPIRITAPIPEDHIDLVPSGDAYLHSSPEVCMKRLLASGYEKIFQICKCFRAGERGHRHLPELTLLEWYTVASDYHHMMTQCAALVRHTAAAVLKQDVINYRGRIIDLKPPWPRITVAEAFETFAGLSPEAALDSDRFDELLTTRVEPGLNRRTPVFLYDYPLRCAALARSRTDHPAVAERFELYAGGLELCNGFSELTDPLEQRRRFEQVRRFRNARGKPVYPLPGRFLDALAVMPPCAGNALGLDRLVMLFADTDMIDDVVAFTPEEL
jgi:lysyl-tRNA synthetase class 2